MAATVLAAVVTVLALHAFFVISPYRTDFRGRYNEGSAWRNRGQLYTLNPSLNTHPPIVTALFFSPLSRLPYRSAQALATCLNMIGVLASLRRIARELRLTPLRVVWMSSLLLASQGMFQQWAMGQFIGILLYPVTRAWIAYRSGYNTSAGLWLLPVVVIKPPLVLLALLLPFRSWAATLGGALVVFAIAIVVTGIDPWGAWLRAGSEINWLALPLNASLWGMAARWQQGSCRALRMGELAWPAIASVVAAAGALWWHGIRQTDHDRRFLCAGLWSVLLSPLGWVYYLPLVTGAATATWPNSRLAYVSYLFLLAPVGRNDPASGVLSGSIMFLGVMCAWVSWFQGEPQPRNA